MSHESVDQDQLYVHARCDDRVRTTSHGVMAISMSTTFSFGVMLTKSWIWACSTGEAGEDLMCIISLRLFDALEVLGA